MENSKKQVILTILDGWGYSQIPEGNTIYEADLPFFKGAWQNCPRTLLKASSEAVGLRWGELGNSEVGHMAIGSGRVIPSVLNSITQAINDKSFNKNPAFLYTLDRATTQKKSLHLVGLASAGGVHSHIEHLQALLILISNKKFRGPVFIHVFTDGRDTAPKIADLYLKKINSWLKEYKIWGRIATLGGRYYAMDRDNRWDRTKLAYDTLIGQGKNKANSAQEWIQSEYKLNHNDEFIRPAIILEEENTPPPQKGLFKSPYYGSLKDGSIKNGDSIIFYNYRPDRMRQLLELFTLPSPHFPDLTKINDLAICTMTEYSQFFNVKIAFLHAPIKNTLADLIASHKMSQLHIAETEKFAHVTYFFNAVQSDKHAGENWKIISSPKVATYDKAPKMSAEKITEELLHICQKEFYNFIVINFANADMVGHTGDFNATINAIKYVDEQLLKIRENFPNSYMLITADHGNCEQMIDIQTKSINKEHSLNPVPLVLLEPGLSFEIKSSPKTALAKASVTGILGDIAPTILDIYNIPKPAEMTGVSLLSSLTAKAR